VIGPKVYIARGPSGHSETFKREPADQALVVRLGKVPLKTAIEGFIRQKSRDKTPDEWSDVIIYLGALIHIVPDFVPLDVAVSFWAHVIQTRDADARAEKGN
jgi:hypothetical protein